MLRRCGQATLVPRETVCPPGSASDPLSRLSAAVHHQSVKFSVSAFQPPRPLHYHQGETQGGATATSWEGDAQALLSVGSDQQFKEAAKTQQRGATVQSGAAAAARPALPTAAVGNGPARGANADALRPQPSGSASGSAGGAAARPAQPPPDQQAAAQRVAAAAAQGVRSTAQAPSHQTAGGGLAAPKPGTLSSAGAPLQPPGCATSVSVPTAAAGQPAGRGPGADAGAQQPGAPGGHGSGPQSDRAALQLHLQQVQVQQHLERLRSHHAAEQQRRMQNPYARPTSTAAPAAAPTVAPPAAAAPAAVPLQPLAALTDGAVGSDLPQHARDDGDCSVPSLQAEQGAQQPRQEQGQGQPPAQAGPQRKPPPPLVIGGESQQADRQRNTQSHPMLPPPPKQTPSLTRLPQLGIPASAGSPRDSALQPESWEPDLWSQIALSPAGSLPLYGFGPNSTVGPAAQTFGSSGGALQRSDSWFRPSPLGLIGGGSPGSSPPRQTASQRPAREWRQGSDGGRAQSASTPQPDAGLRAGQASAPPKTGASLALGASAGASQGSLQKRKLSVVIPVDGCVGRVV